MSQSLGNYVSIVDPPNEMFGKTMSIPDSIMENWFELCTDVPTDEYRTLFADAHAGKVNPRDVKRRLATEIVTHYHSPEEANAADAHFMAVFSEREKPGEAEDVAIPDTVVQNDAVSLPHLIAELGLAKSASHARHLIEQGAVSLDGTPFTDLFGRVAVWELKGKVLRVGKHQFRKLV